MSILNSEIYSSINETGNITNLFFVNVSNLLRTRSSARNLIKILKKEVTYRMISETVLKEVYIERYMDDPNYEIYETICDLKTNNLTENRIGIYNAPSLFVEQSPERKCIFKRVNNLLSINQQTTKAYSFKDYMKNSSLKNKFKYRIELTFVDGIRIFLENILKSFKSYISSLNQIKTISENDRLLLQSGTYNLNNFNKRGLPNAINLDYSLTRIVNFYFDFLNLLNNTNIESYNISSLKSEQLGKISFISGKHEYLIQFYDKFLKLYEYLRTTSDEDDKDIQLMGNNKPKKGTKSNSRKESAKEIDLIITSDTVDHYKNFDGLISYVAENAEETDTISIVTKTNIMKGAMFDPVTGSLKKKAYSYIKRGKKESISNSVETIISLNNSQKQIQNAKAMPFYDEAENINEEQTDSLSNAMSYLSSVGITFESNEIEKNRNTNTTRVEEYSKDLSETSIDLTTNTDKYTEMEAIKFTELPNTIVEIAKNHILNDSFMSKDKKPVYTNSTEAFDPSMTNDIEYLSGFESGGQIYDSFIPSWKPLTNSQLNLKGYLICRNYNRTNNPLTNYLSINEYFLLHLG